MNIVNFRGKDEILFKFYKRDKELEFLLYDIKSEHLKKRKPLWCHKKMKKDFQIHCSILDMKKLKHSLGVWIFVK